MKTPLRPRVLLADDHTVVVEGVRAILARDFELVGIAKDGCELLKLAPDLEPDVIVVDIAMPSLNGLDATVQLKQNLPNSPVIVMSGHKSSAYVRAALRSGALGYVAKTKAEELPDAIRTVLRGNVFLSSDVDRHALGKPEKQSESPLSPREREVLQLIAEGKLSKEIAAIMGVSIRTVEFHRYNIMNKLNLRTAAELTRYAIQEGIVARD